jgi:hypothetical protein
VHTASCRRLLLGLAIGLVARVQLACLLNVSIAGLVLLVPLSLININTITHNSCFCAVLCCCGN